MLKRRVKNKKAFTLAETLVAILIMLMASSVLVTGIPAAKNAYEKVFVKSNAEVLMTTGIYALRNELSLSKNVEIDKEDKTKISYLSNKKTIGSIIKVDNNNGIIIRKFRGELETSTSKKESDNIREEWEPLISKKASDNMIIKYKEIKKSANKNYIVICDLEIYKSKTDTNPILKRNELAISIM